MKRRAVLMLGLYAALCVYPSVSLAAQTTTPAGTSSAAVSGGREQCEALEGRRLGGGTILEAAWIESGTPLLSFFMRTMLRIALMGKSAGIDAPRDFCRIAAELQPVPGSEIAVGVWLPQAWNGKMLGAGGGGFNGGLEIAGFILKDPVGKGYVALATDAGHEVTESAKFAYESAEQLKDYGYRANHLGAEFAKALIAAYYGKPVQRAYFHGCSNGGRDALMLAHRFPADYDAIIAGAPAADFTGVILKHLWNRQAFESAPKLHDKLKMVGDAIIAKCDALDGIKDGLLENPLSCAFNPAELQCKNGTDDVCLNAAEVAALQNIYGGPRLPDGTQVYPGQPIGGEGVEDNWGGPFDQAEETIGSEGLRWLVHRDPEWTADRFNLARDAALAKERVGAILNSNSPDLSGFMSRGGKLMLYHGWNDIAIPATATLDYHAALRAKLGSVADQQTRLFMVPGMLHCGGGPGATDFDQLEELDRWVESGVAPERIVAREYDPPALALVIPGSKVVGTRPLCAWPKQAKYSGKGSPKDAANFDCR